MIDGYDPRVDSLLKVVSMQDAHTFFGDGVLPRYREDAARLIPNSWDTLTPNTRNKIFQGCFDGEDCGNDWEALAKSFPSGEAERRVITHLFGDTTNPLYE